MESPSISRRSSTEEDYREVFQAAIHDRLRDGLQAQMKTHPKKPRRKQHDFHYTRQQDEELTRIATTLSTDVGIAPKTLSEIDPRLDPENENFDFGFWASTFIQLVREDGIHRANVGFSFRSLTVSGNESSMALQSTVASPWIALARLPMLFKKEKRPPKVILHSFNGSIKSGEMLIVLGRPGSGCSTFLRAISGNMTGLTKSSDSTISYDGIPQETFVKNFKGRACYNQEDDEHFPHLTVGQTLQFAATARTPHTRIQGVGRETHAHHMVEVMMRIFGLTHTRDTKVGNDTVRGVSGGERKRVSIAEMALARASIAAWDNSTRGLDSATALEFVRSLRIMADVPGITQAVAIYQASQSIYDVFDKVLVLYEGRQIFFGPADVARSYFETMGWYCPPRQTTPDFLTSVTNPTERRPREDFTGAIPRTAAEFEQYWLSSEDFKTCMAELSQAEKEVQQDDRLQGLKDLHRQLQANHTRDGSPYLISVWMQLKLCMKRSRQLTWNDRAATMSLTIGRIILALIIGSIYFGPSNTTASLKSRGSVIFLATLMNALMAVTEIGTLYGKRKIVQKQKTYAFYHPFADAFGAFLVDVPVKFVISTLFNIVFYFLSGLRPEASNFFIFLLFNFLATLVMSVIFRSIGALSKQVAQAYAIAGIGILVMIIYTGFTLQTSYMHPWFRWINYINPIGYIFESLLVNEVHGVNYTCAPPSVIPPYAGDSNFACAEIGAEPNSRVVSGDNWVQSGYGYSYSHIWSNLGIAIGFLIFFLAVYLLAVEFRSTDSAQPQRLIFRNRKAAQALKQTDGDVESTASEKSNKFVSASVDVEEKLTKTTTITEAEAVDRTRSAAAKGPAMDHSGTLTWQDVTLDISIQGKPRRLLDNVTGWVTPGTMTCLMGVSGAGKTTLLDTLAQRHNTVGKVSGDILVDGVALKESFQRKTGYVQQQDLHLPTSTVREALRFSAVLRQPASTPLADKFAYVETVIEMLNMERFSDAIVGQPGEGLNIEQRKLLTIGVELAAKPAILFLDEPTSGLDSQSSWTIICLLRRLTNKGQAILATVHQPSAMLFQQFDSILLLAKGGRTAYFGPLGADCRTLTGYFETGGARACDPKENPAEYMLNVIGDRSRDWPETWKASSQYTASRDVLQNIGQGGSTKREDPDDRRAFAVSFPTQFRYVLVRLLQNYWRTPGYIYAKFQASILAALFIGFTFFLQNSSITGMQNVIFGIYMLNATFSTIVNQVCTVLRAARRHADYCQQIMSRFIPQRSLFEVRESPSRMYSWVSFVLANMLVEIPYQCFLSVLVWASWYFPIFGYHQDGSSQGMMLVFVLQFLLFASTFGQMIIFSMPSTETAGTVSTILFTLTLQFNGVLQPPTALPGFWIFMYRVSPFTYLIGGWAGTGLANRPVVCAQNEMAIFNPPQGQTCGAYLQKYLEGGAPGTLLNPSASAGCEYCPMRNANQFLAQSWIYPSQKYRDMGILFGYIAFNVLAAMSLYYIFRVRRFSMGKLARPKKERSKHVEDGAEGDDHKPRWGRVGFYSHLAWDIFRSVVR